MKNLLPSAYMRSDSCGLRDENRVRAEFEPMADLPLIQQPFETFTRLAMVP